MDSEKKSYFEDTKLIAVTQRDALMEVYKTCDPSSKLSLRITNRVKLLTETIEDCDTYLARA